MLSIPLRRTALALGALVVVTGLLAGCKLVTTPQASGNMYVSVEVQRYLEGNTHISIRFADASNNTIEFVSGETVACDGQFLRYSVGYYVGDVPRQADGGSYSMRYTPANGSGKSAGTSGGPVTFTVPVVASNVTFVQPASGATVPIPSSSPLTITYQPSTLSNTSMYASATDSRYHVTAVLPQADSGSLSIPADNFASFESGPGTLTLVRQTAETVGGSAFAGVTVEFKNLAVESIQWQ